MTPSQNPNLHPLKGVPSGMDNDPNADEEIIDQTAVTPSSEETELEANDQAVGRIPSQQTSDPSSDEFLSEKIAYALAGAEPPIGDPEPRKVTHEGITGASPEDEEEALKS
ncbi:hypothetical protein [Larkinella soli]|uniref:hypothetical protein n=1 Tax=Larkinella soli TaxID=1770527 RepID=UPI000FFB3FED|nr:hypothetical protein [Larkinella soli]